MYDLGPDLDEEVPPGTNILVSGPPLSGKRSLCLDILASGVENGEGAIIVTTKDGADRVLDDFETRTPYEDRPVAVVDCVLSLIHNRRRRRRGQCKSRWDAEHSNTV